MATDKTKKPTLIERGFANTTLNDIAKEAGVSTGVITYHFRNKDDLIEQSIQKLFEAPNEHVISSVNEQTTHRAKLETYILATMEFMIHNRDHAVALIYSFSSISSEAERQRVVARYHERIRRFLARLLKSGQEAGEFGALDPDVLAHVVLGAIQGLVTQWVLDEDAVNLPAAAGHLVEMVEKHVLPS